MSAITAIPGPLLNPRTAMPISCIFTSFRTFLHDSDLRLICVHQRQVLIFQFRRCLAIPAILAISQHPTPPPYVDPIRPKVTQFDPMLRRSAVGHSLLPHNALNRGPRRARCSRGGVEDDPRLKRSAEGHKSDSALAD